MTTIEEDYIAINSEDVIVTATDNMPYINAIKLREKLSISRYIDAVTDFTRKGKVVDIRKSNCIFCPVISTDTNPFKTRGTFI